MLTESFVAAPTALAVDVQGLSASFAENGGRLAVLRDITFQVAAGQFVALLGPSGSGKSTLLAILAGLAAPDSGQVTLWPAGGAAPLPRRLGQVALMPQRDLLLPWRTALDNATAALEVGGMRRAEARDRARLLFAEFGLGHFAGHYPHELSGGMRQRVSFMRSALAARGLMLLDEPFGALDALTRAGLHEWLLEAAARLGSTFILVTHDVDEAVLLSDRVYVLSPRPGRLIGALDSALPRPRTLDSTADPRFQEARRHLLDLLRGAGSLATPEEGRA